MIVPQLVHRNKSKSQKKKYKSSVSHTAASNILGEGSSNVSTEEAERKNLNNSLKPSICQAKRSLVLRVQVMKIT